MSYLRRKLAALLLLCILGGTGYLSTLNAESIPHAEFAKLPVLEGGRYKPIDTIARNALLFIQGRQRIQVEGVKKSPTEWLMLAATQPEKTDEVEMFLVENPAIFSFVGEKYTKQKYRVSYTFLEPHFDMIFTAASKAGNLEAAQRTAYQREIIRLKNRIWVYMRLKNTLKPENTSLFEKEIDHFLSVAPKGVAEILKTNGNPLKNSNEMAALNLYFQRYQALDESAYFYPIPPSEEGSSEWQSVGTALLNTLRTNNQVTPALTHYAKMLDSLKANDVEGFHRAITDFSDMIASQYPDIARQVRMEYFFNKFEFFYKSILLYLVIIALLLVFWTTHRLSAYKLSLWLFYGAVVLHSAGLGFRMWLIGRPPVTNLYSSAIFVGWISVLVAVLIERFNKTGLGILCGSIIGALTLIVAHHLSLSGDTLEMMQAVLDSNFWLSTHVITITAGYGAILFAGTLANIYILRGFLTRSLGTETAKQITKLVYGTLAFGLLLSFIGTVLGGIWADQSWGRFWGWDPKENGAILIVLWTAIILHARIGGYIQARGMMVLSVLGNIVVAFSWWGVNLLGIGLHSYGFMEKGFVWLMTFYVSQLAIAILGCMPLRIWNSSQNDTL